MTSHRSTPEQVLGNLFQFIITLRQRGVNITRRTQALGSAAVDTLRREGWIVVRYDEDKDVDRLTSLWRQEQARADVLREQLRFAEAEVARYRTADTAKSVEARPSLSGSTIGAQDRADGRGDPAV